MSQGVKHQEMEGDRALVPLVVLDCVHFVKYYNNVVH